jgi:ABC-type bacteriocin/lantibiotic exporter with double-glycine peptidase domain
LVSYFYLLLRALQVFSVGNQALSTLMVTWPNFNMLLKWWAERSHDELYGPRPEEENWIKAPPSRAPIGWRLSHVAFAYPGAAAWALRDVSFSVAPGETFVIVGPSGAGKSTLLAVMLGGLKPQEGTVELLSGEEPPCALEERRGELLRSIGYVGPESFLIDGSIRENLFYGLRAAAAQAAIETALKQAECQFVFDLPRGLDHRITEQGQGLSAGQKQRLCLARALLRQPKVLLLDEATSNLDLATEERLVDTLAQLKETMTIVAVTHRETLLRIADRTVALGSSPVLKS